VKINTTDPNVFDFVVIGAGIAGASAAAELAKDAKVLLLEAESQPGYHTTGRSAAIFTCSYGPKPIRALSRASEAFFRNPDSEHIEHPLLNIRQVIFAARADQHQTFNTMQQELGEAVTAIDGERARELVPLLRQGYVSHALHDQNASDIDVATLHQHFLKSFRALGGQTMTKSGVTGLNRDGANWQVETHDGKFKTRAIVNAAGAWCDEIAQLAGTQPIGLVPKRRSALIVPAPENLVGNDWPLVVDVDEQFYLKPEAGKFLISPADETPSSPCDAQPEDIDVAICVDRIEKAFDLQVTRIEQKWAGLRSFVSDKCPVVGYDEKATNLFWLAGQGGYGIQTAPALAKVAAALALGNEVPQKILDHGVSIDTLSPNRPELRP